MSRLTVSLPADLSEQVRKEARRLRMPVSALVREAIERRLGLCEAPLRQLPFEYIVEGDDPHLSENIDRILAEEWPDAIMGDR